MTGFNEKAEAVRDVLPATAPQIADTLGVDVSYAYGVIGEMKNSGDEVAQDVHGRYYIVGETDPDDTLSNTTALRQDSSTKATITRKAKEYLTELEQELEARLAETEPARADGGLAQEQGHQDLVIHRTDDHFGELITNQNGDVVFDSGVAEARVHEVFDNALQAAEAREEIGTTFDTAHLLLGGDIVTNEAIYEGQSHDIDEALDKQLDRAAGVYVENIKRLADRFPTVQVACQPGNHGRLGKGNSANADSILYSIIDRVIRESGFNNVTVLQSDRSYYLNFNIRDWNAHLRHGHDASLEHIGTSAAKHRWQSWLIDHDFDVAFRGHYHSLKEEPVNGRPVVMGGSIVPQTEFEESQALSGRAMGAIHGATDNYPLAWTDRIYFG